jgi:hypothetical protein
MNACRTIPSEATGRISAESDRRRESDEGEDSRRKQSETSDAGNQVPRETEVRITHPYPVTVPFTIHHS